MSVHATVSTIRSDTSFRALDSTKLALGPKTSNRTKAPRNGEILIFSVEMRGTLDASIASCKASCTSANALG